MEFGFGVPMRGPLATAESLVPLVERGEALGFDIVTVSDHVVIPRAIASRYPYSESGSFPGGAGACMEQLTLLSFLAARTSRLRLLTSVMVVPHRPAVLAAKALATIDVLSGGRLIVGCGVGWMREEFEALGAPDYDRRGAVSDEYITAFKELWTSDTPTLRGEFASFANIIFEPKPVQTPHPSIWVGGESPAALRRAGRLGDAWYPIGNNPAHPMGTVEALAAGMARVRGHAEQAGRDPAQVGLAYSAGWYNDREATTLPDGTRRVFTGVPEQVAEDVAAFAQVGVGQLVVNLQAGTVEETLERMQRCAELVRPLVRA